MADAKGSMSLKVCRPLHVCIRRTLILYSWLSFSVLIDIQKLRLNFIKDSFRFIRQGKWAAADENIGYVLIKLICYPPNMLYIGPGQAIDLFSVKIRNLTINNPPLIWPCEHIRYIFWPGIAVTFEISLGPPFPPHNSKQEGIRTIFSPGAFSGSENLLLYSYTRIFPSRASCQ